MPPNNPTILPRHLGFCPQALFRLVFLVCHHQFRLTKLEFDLLAVAYLPDALENDFLVPIKSFAR